VDQPRPARRMSDMGPRNMQGTAQPRPVGTRPTQPVGRPQVARPIGRSPQQGQMAPAQPARPMRQPQPMQQVRPAQPTRQVQQTAAGQVVRSGQVHGSVQQMPVQQKPARSKRGGGWKIIAQFFVGLLVIALVATAVVMLYIKYYSQ
jgi:hypothetical protein